jgi:hypothetical protein
LIEKTLRFWLIFANEKRVGTDSSRENGGGGARVDLEGDEVIVDINQEALWDRIAQM